MNTKLKNTRNFDPVLQVHNLPRRHHDSQPCIPAYFKIVYISWTLIIAVNSTNIPWTGSWSIGLPPSYFQRLVVHRHTVQSLIWIQRCESTKDRETFQPALVWGNIFRKRSRKDTITDINARERASAQNFFSFFDVWRNDLTQSMGVQFIRSATLFCCGLYATVSWCWIMRSCKYDLNSSDMYSPPLSVRSALLLQQLL